MSLVDEVTPLPDENPAEISVRVRSAIIDHLRRYPLAGDTLEGIVSCWLPSRYRDKAAQVVESMVLAGELALRPLPDGRALYVRGPALPESSQS
jgi:hypothetical protein